MKKSNSAALAQITEAQNQILKKVEIQIEQQLGKPVALVAYELRPEENL
ncbi:hypothetical protein MUG87_05200 [Ectobacillus sp. JY-23]|nr:hypothetical protein [Ectobacillus sp. JY-23]UOY93522.1 hypothetical protein MUG87_05200 [Ectobacillus sp. JY-23]